MLTLNEAFLILWISIILVGFLFILDEAVLQPSRNKKLYKELLCILNSHSLKLKEVKDICQTRSGTIRYIDDILIKIKKEILLNSESSEELKSRIEDLIRELEKEKRVYKLPIEIQDNFKNLDKELPNSIDLNVALEKLPYLLKEKDTFFRKVFKLVTIIFSFLGVFSSIITIDAQFNILDKIKNIFI